MVLDIDCLITAFFYHTMMQDDAEMDDIEFERLLDHKHKLGRNERKMCGRALHIVFLASLGMNLVLAGVLVLVHNRSFTKLPSYETGFSTDLGQSTNFITSQESNPNVQ